MHSTMASGVAMPARCFLLYSVHVTVNHAPLDRKSTRLNTSHGYISYAVFSLTKKGSNDPNPDKAVSRFVHGCMARPAICFLNGAFTARPFAVPANIVHLVASAGKLTPSDIKA